MTPHEWVTGLLVASLIATSLYALMFFMYVCVMLVLAAIESIASDHQRPIEPYEALLTSTYTIPVTVIAPAYNEEVMVVAAVRSMLDFEYPEFDVILVDDGSKDATLDELKKAFDLQPAQVFYRAILPTQRVRAIYKSRTNSRLTVVAKEHGGKADAMNCGVNFARYRYVCLVDGDTVFAADALLRAMALIVKDPARIVGVGSLFGVSRLPETAASHVISPHELNHHALTDFQHLDMIRSFVAYRMAWTRIGSMLCVPGAFGVWRRDLILEMGGYSPNFTCEDIEMTFRIHEKLRREKRPYRILSLPVMVAQTEGPVSVKSLISQRARWQRVTLETVWHYRRMLWRRTYGSVGMVGLPYYLLFEGLAPIVQLLAFGTLIASMMYGLMAWRTYLYLLGIMVFATGLPTTVAVGLHDNSFRDYSPKDLLRMIVLGALDFILYRPIIAYAGIRGLIEFLQGKKDWYRFERNVRRAAA